MGKYYFPHSMGDRPYQFMPDINLSCKGIQNLLDNLRVNEAPAPNRIPVRIRKDYSGEIAPILQFILKLSFHKGELPDDWQTADMCHFLKMFQRATTKLPPYFSPSYCYKIMEHVLCHMAQLDKNNILSNSQHGFRVKHSCESQLLSIVDSLARSLDNHKQIDVLILGFSKAFDTVPHQRLLLKLKHCGIQGKTWRWIISWLTNSLQHRGK